jgi:hypothetical protein
MMHARVRDGSEDERALRVVNQACGAFRLGSSHFGEGVLTYWNACGEMMTFSPQWRRSTSVAVANCSIVAG